MKTILVCGSRLKNISAKKFYEYETLVFRELDNHLNYDVYLKDIPKRDLQIINGGCDNSADLFSSIYAKGNDIVFTEYKGYTGYYLKRNIHMVKMCDEILAFWDGFSYGTSHTIATGILYNKPVKIIKVEI